jgi:hypothetical protein
MGTSLKENTDWGGWEKGAGNSKKKDTMGDGESRVTTSFTICDLRHVLIGVTILRNVRWDGHIARMG